MARTDDSRCRRRSAQWIPGGLDQHNSDHRIASPKSERCVGPVDRAGARGAWISSYRPGRARIRSEEHTSELQSLMRNSYAVFCLKKKTNIIHKHKRRHKHNTEKNINK